MKVKIFNMSGDMNNYINKLKKYYQYEEIDDKSGWIYLSTLKSMLDIPSLVGYSCVFSRIYKGDYIIMIQDIYVNYSKIKEESEKKL